MPKPPLYVGTSGSNAISIEKYATRGETVFFILPLSPLTDFLAEQFQEDLGPEGARLRNSVKV
jgi:hypothetical protein